MTDVVDHLIGADWRPSEDGRRFETRDPHDDSLLALVAEGGPADAARALAAARRAFDDGPWPRMSAEERRSAAPRLRRSRGPRRRGPRAARDARHGQADPRGARHDLPRVSRNLRFFADYAAHGRQRGVPRRPCALRTCATSPPASSSRSGPGTSRSCRRPGRWRPRSRSATRSCSSRPSRRPLTAARLGALASRRDCPQGVLNVVHGFGRRGRRGLTRDPGVDRDHVHRRERDRPRDPGGGGART